MACPDRTTSYLLDILHPQHAVVEDRVRTEKATGIRNLPCKGFERNAAWLSTANIASDMLAHLQLLGLEPDSGLAAAEPESTGHTPPWEAPQQVADLIAE